MTLGNLGEGMLGPRLVTDVFLHTHHPSISHLHTYRRTTGSTICIILNNSTLEMPKQLDDIQQRRLMKSLGLHWMIVPRRLGKTNLQRGVRQCSWGRWIRGRRSCVLQRSIRRRGWWGVRGDSFGEFIVDYEILITDYQLSQNNRV